MRFPTLGNWPIRTGLFALALCASLAHAQNAPTARDNNARARAARADSITPPRSYSITNPVPRALLRELSTDRPGRTENAFTVDVGHLQFEMGVADMTDDRREGARLQSFGFGALSARIGLRHNIDLQIITKCVTIERDLALGTRVSVTPVSDITARLKVNMWGNDGGQTAFAVMPYVTVPTSTQGLVLRDAEGGVSLPLGIDLGRGWGLGLMSQFDVVHDDQGLRYQPSVVHSATVSHAIVGPVGGYVGVVGEIAAARGARLQATGDAGITIGVTPDFQFDLGANVGLTRSTERVTASFGVSKRY